MDREFKIKSLEEVEVLQNDTLKEIKTEFKIQTILMIIVIILASVICFKAMSLAIDYEALNKEKQVLEDLTEAQSSMISDLEENCKNLYIEIENLKFGGNE